MPKRLSTLFALALLVTFGFAKDKTKNALPAYVLQARTVAVITDPSAGMSIDDPQANQRAQRDVEAAMVKWGRFELVSKTEDADLIIVVRKGNGRSMDETMPDIRQNGGGGINNSGNGGGSLGSQRVSPPGSPTEPGLGPNQQDPHSQAGIGGAEDSFAVFERGQNSMDATPAWKYRATDGLSPQTVPAVAAFKKAVAAAEKAAQKP